MIDKHIIVQSASMLDALKQINTLGEKPLVLLVVDEQERMVGTLTDGDSRRALIAGASVGVEIKKVMHRDFHYLTADCVDNVQQIRQLREMRMKLIPVLDTQRKIVDVINLQKFKSRLPIDAVLMAGGKGERLRPLTENTPKPLIKVGDKCIIDYNIERLLSYGVNHISVTVNYLGEQIEQHFQEKRDGIKVETVREPEFLGTIGSVKFVKAFHNDTVLVMNSDLFTNIDYEDFYLHFCQNKVDMSIAAVPYVVKVPYGVFALNGREIKGVEEKPIYNYYVNAGIYLIKRKCFNLIPENEFFNATDFMDKMIATRHRIIRYPISGFWIDIGRPEELARAKEMVSHIKGF